MAKKKRKKISKQEKSFKAKVYKANSKNKQVKKEISELEKLDGRLIYEYETNQEKKYRLAKQKKLKVKLKPKRRRLKTIINIKRNEITKNNTKVERSLKTLQNKFKYKPKNFGKKEFKSKKGTYLSGEYLAWETKEPTEWITAKVKGNSDNKKLASFIIQINEVHEKMSSKDLARGVYTVGKSLDYYYYKNPKYN